MDRVGRAAAGCKQNRTHRMCSGARAVEFSLLRQWAKGKIFSTRREMKGQELKPPAAALKSQSMLLQTIE